MQVICEKQDLTFLTWSKIRNSSGTAGSFLKAYSELGGRKIYYKLSNYDSMQGIIGHECVNEIIVDRLLTVLGIEHLNYRLIHADILLDGRRQTTWLCASDDYKKAGETKIALETYYQAERMEGENPLAFCIRNGWEEYIYRMLVVDFLILNRDRHGANIEVLRNARKKEIRLAPLFDHGLSLLFGCMTEEEVAAADGMEDKRVQCFVGSGSVKENLNLIPPDHRFALPTPDGQIREFLFEGLTEAAPQFLLNKIWQMIEGRWHYYEGFCNPGRE